LVKKEKSFGKTLEMSSFYDKMNHHKNQAGIRLLI
jgi:hypothetical protein